MAANAWTPQPGELVAERFHLLRELGRGGMGTVWLADHVTLDAQCAVKFVLADLGTGASAEEAYGRFRGEARAAASFRSRHVVRVLDYGTWQGTPYLAMELLVGESLRDRLMSCSKLSPAETLAIMRGVSRALAAAAEAGVIHRDLKPDNVFLAREDAEECVKILDFGVAKTAKAMLETTDRHTRSGALVGTPHYMSPEQIDGIVQLDHRSDLWAASVITYQCLTGELPFDSAAVGNLMMKIMSAPRPVPSSLAPELPRAFDAWWHRATARNPKDRHPSAESWYADLEQALGGTSAEAVDFRAAPRAAAGAEVLAAALSPAARIGTLGGQTWPPPLASRRSPALAGLIAIAALGVVLFAIWALTRSAGPTAEVRVDAAPAPAAGEAESASDPDAPPPDAAPPVTAPPTVEPQAAAPENSASSATPPTPRTRSPRGVPRKFDPKNSGF